MQPLYECFSNRISCCSFIDSSARARSSGAMIWTGASRVSMCNDVALMRTPNELHTPVLCRCRRQGDPRRHFGNVVEVPIGEVLMPTDKCRRVRFFHEEAGAEHQEVGSQNVGDGGGDLGQSCDLIDDGQHDVREAVQEFSIELSPRHRLGRFELGRIPRGFGPRKNWNRKYESVVLVGRHHHHTFMRANDVDERPSINDRRTT